MISIIKMPQLENGTSGRNIQFFARCRVLLEGNRGTRRPILFTFHSNLTGRPEWVDHILHQQNATTEQDA
jgi:hypothetical protein